MTEKSPVMKKGRNISFYKSLFLALPIVCVMGAIVLAIVLAKPAELFTSSPDGSLYGMVVKAKADGLNLACTIWGLRMGGRRE